MCTTTNTGTMHFARSQIDLKWFPAHLLAGMAGSTRALDVTLYTSDENIADLTDGVRID